MINSKLVGKTLPEIIHMIVFEELTSVTYHDGEYMESLLQEYTHSSEREYLNDKIVDLENELADAEDYIEVLEELLKENGIEFD